jgi:hypothetical protein
MDADQRLLALEVAAHALNDGGTTGELVTRGRLVDRFNMLILPGTRDLLLCGPEHAERKARYYIYEVLREAAVSGKVDPKYLEMLEAAAQRRNRATDSIVQQISSTKLRLISDSNKN